VSISSKFYEQFFFQKNCFVFFAIFLLNTVWLCNFLQKRIGAQNIICYNVSEIDNSLPEERMQHCSVGFNEQLAFIIGGQNLLLKLISKSVMFNATNGVFSYSFTLTRPRLNPVCNIVGSKIVVAGGFTTKITGFTSAIPTTT